MKEPVLRVRDSRAHRLHARLAPDSKNKRLRPWVAFNFCRFFGLDMAEKFYAHLLI